MQFIKVKYAPFGDQIAGLPVEIKLVYLSPNSELNENKQTDDKQELKEKETNRLNIKTDTKTDSKIEKNLEEMISKSLENPIGSESLRDIIQDIMLKKNISQIQDLKIIVITDDHTRITPVKTILPILFQYLESWGILRKQIKILVAGGSHRLMTSKELEWKFGNEIIDNVSIIQHNWSDRDKLISFGTVEPNIEVLLNPLIAESHIKIAIGNIVPHEIAGFSGGYKMIIPGSSTRDTVEKIHWLSTKVPINKRLGITDNPIRNKINEAGVKSGLNFIINSVLDPNSHIAGIFSGDPVKAQEEGCKLSEQIFSVEANPTNIIITDCYPEKTDFWTAAKAVLHTSAFVKKGGIMICCAACPEGVALTHPQILKMGYKSPEELEQKFGNDIIFNRLSATHCANLWEIQQHCRIFLVTQGITEDEAELLGFYHFTDLQEAIDRAISFYPDIEEINVISHGSEIMKKKSMTN